MRVLPPHRMKTSMRGRLISYALNAALAAALVLLVSSIVYFAPLIRSGETFGLFAIGLNAFLIVVLGIYVLDDRQSRRNLNRPD